MDNLKVNNILDSLNSLDSSNTVQDNSTTENNLDSIAKKKLNLASIAETKKANLSPVSETPSNLDSLTNIVRDTAARELQSPSYRQSSLYDYDTMLSKDFKEKYELTDSEFKTYVESLRGSASKRFEDTTLERSGVDIAKDAVSDVFVGGYGLLSGALAATGSVMDTVGRLDPTGGYLMNGDLANNLSDWASSNAESIREGKSDDSKRQTEQAQLDREIQLDDLASEYSDKEGFASSLAQIGEEMSITAKNLIDNPEQIGSLVVESVPSLAASSGIGGLVARSGAGASRLSAQELTKRSMAAQPAINAVLEGGSSAAAIRQEFNDMSDEFLLENSIGFKELSDKHGIQKARELITRDASVMALALQGASGALTSKINARFEAAPLSMPGKGTKKLAEAGKDIVLETVEEATQGLTGTVSENLAVQTYADNRRSLTEGLGSNIVEGAFAGAGLAGATKSGAIASGSASLALTATVGAAKVGTLPISTAYNYFSNKAQSEIDADIATRDPLSEEKINEGIQETSNNIAKLEEIISETPVEVIEEISEDTAVSEPSNEEQQSEEVSEPTQVKVDQPNPIQTIVDAYKITEEEVSEYPQEVQNIVSNEDSGGISNRLDAVKNLYFAYESTEDAGAKEDILMALYKNVRTLWNASEWNDSIRNFIESENTSEEVVNIFNAIVQTRDAVLNNPALQELIFTMDDLRVEDSVNIGEDNLDSNLAKRAIEKSIMVSEVNPLNSNPVVVDNILDLSKKRKISLTEDQVRKLSAASGLSKLVRLFTLTEEEFASRELNNIDDAVASNRKTHEEVRNGIISSGFDSKDGYKQSLIEHIDSANTFSLLGDTDSLKEQLRRLTSFARGQVNKTTAIDKSSKGGKGEKFRPLIASESGKMVPSSGEYYFRDNSPKSTENYFRIFEDATLAVAVQNMLANAYPEAGIAPMELPHLSRSIAQKSARQSKKAEMIGALVVQNKQEVLVTPIRESKSEQLNLDFKKEPEQETNKSEEVTEVLNEIPVEEPKKEASKEQKKPEISEKETQPKEDLSSLVPKRQPIKERFSKLNKGQHRKSEQKLDISEIFNTGRSNKLTDIEEAIDTVTKEVSKHTNSGASKGYTVLMKGARSLVNNVQKSLVDNLKSKIKDKTLRDNPEIMDYPNMKSLMITEGDTDTGITYNKELIEKASLAVMDWIAKSFTRADISAERFSQSLGIPESMFGSAIWNYIEQGNIPLSSVGNELSNSILKFWGFTPKKDVERTFSDGLAGAIAMEFIEILTTSQDGKPPFLVRTSVNNPLTNLPIWGIHVNKEGLGENVYEGMRSIFSKYPDVISDSVFEQSEKTHYVGVKPEPKKRGAKYLRGTEKISDIEINALNSISSREHTINRPYVNFVRALGVEAYSKLIGYTELGDENQYNINHYKSVSGKNTSVLTNIRSMLELVELAEEHSPESPDSVPIYFDTEMSSVNRAQYRGIGNPQANKTSREALVSTWSNLDLSKEEDRSAFWLTVGQMSDLMKVERHAHTPEFFKEIEETVRNRYGESIEVFGEFLHSGDLTTENVRILTNNIRGNSDGVDDFVIHAIMSIARYDLAMASKDNSQIKNFKHGLALEADGVTNGPANAYIKLNTGEFTQNQLDTFERVGLLFGNEQRLMSDKNVKMDLYEATTVLSKEANIVWNKKLEEGTKGKGRYLVDSALRTKLKNSAALFIRGSEASYNPKEVRDAIGRLFTYFPPYGVKTDKDGNWVMDRNSVKNPLTKTTYGAGLMGTARGITNDLLNDIFKKASLLIEGGFEEVTNNNIYPTFMEDMNILLNTRVMESKDGRIYTISHDQNISKTLRGKDLSRFSLNASQFEALASNIAKVYVTPLLQGVDASMGKAKSTMNHIVRASQLMGEIGQEIYSKINNIDPEKGTPTNDRRRLGSPAEHKKNLELLDLILPIMRTADQILDISNISETMAVTDSGESIIISETISGKTSFSHTVRTPVDIGVSAAANINIGTGDGLMMTYGNADTNLYGKETPEGIKRTLSVFDGQNIDAKSIAEVSEWMNRAATKVWETNTLQDFTNTFEQFVRLLPKDGLGSSAFGREAEGILKILQDRSLEAEARIRAIKKFSRSVDQMAGGGNSFFIEGRKLKEGEDLLTELNKEYNKELKLLEAGTVKSNPKIFKNIKKGSKRRITKKEMRSIISEMDPKHKQVFGQLLYSNILDEYTVLVGTQESFPDLKAAGQIDLSKKEIRLIDPDMETFIHELIHSVVGNKVNQYFMNKDVMAESDKAAIENLIKLQDHFMKLEGVSNEERSALNDLLIAVYDTTTEAGKLNEFIAWTLSNPQLIEIGTKQKTTKSLLSSMKAAYRTILKLVGIKTNDVSLYGQILVNARVLSQSNTEEPSSSGSNDSEVILNHNRKNEPLSRAVEVIEEFDTFIGDHINFGEAQDRLKKETKKVSMIGDVYVAGRPLLNLTKAGFTFDPVERDSFVRLQTLFFSGVGSGGVPMVRAQELYEAANEQLKPEHFKGTPEEQQRKYDALFGDRVNTRTRKTNNDAFSVFMSLSQSNKEFRDALTKVSFDPKTKINKDNIDTLLNSATLKVMNAHKEFILGSPDKENGVTTVDLLDHVSRELFLIDSDKRSKAETIINTAADTVDNKVSSIIQDSSQKAIDWLRDKNKDNKEADTRIAKISDSILSTATNLLSVINKNESKNLSLSVMESLNKAEGLYFTKDLFRDNIGMTDINKAVFKHINKVKYFVSGVREEYREKVPKVIAKSFSRKLSKDENTALHTGIGRSDLSLLLDSYSFEEVIKLVRDKKKRDSEINNLSVGFNQRTLKKAENLARFMTTGETSYFVEPNAEAIYMGKSTSEEGSIADLDKLITLMSLNEMPKDQMKLFSSLAQKETEGFKFSIAYIKDKRNKEYAKNNNEEGIVKYNQFKGYIPSEGLDDVSVKIASDFEHRLLENTGFTRVGDFEGDIGYGVYVTKSGTQNTYTQGAAQTAQNSVNGTDTVTGRRVNGITSGDVIKNNKTFSNIKRNMNSLNPPKKGSYMPIRDKAGVVIGFERLLTKEYSNLKSKNTQFGEMVGAWAGRQIEEKGAVASNHVLVDLTKEVFDKEYDRDPSQFINIADPNVDPVYKDSWNSIPRDMKNYIKEVFNEDNYFPVRREMVELTVGHRNAGVSDLWTGISRHNENISKVARNIAISIFKRDAYEKLTALEKGLQGVVSDAKNLVVVKSVIVPVANIISNVYQLAQVGVPLRSIISGTSKTVIELNKYLDNHNRLVGLLADYQTEENKGNKDRLRAKIEAIRDVNRRLDIWPLIEAGEFGTISEGLTEADVSLREGRFSQWVENQAEKLPGGLRDLGRYGLLSQNTALYQGLNRAVQYGDFIAKAILYDDLTKRRRTSSKEALEKVTEEFVNYNIPAGRGRTYLESVGLLWFWNFKVRSIKVAMRTMRDNPVRALLGTYMMPDWGSLNVGTPITDNLLSIGADGKLGYSMGPGMGFRSIFLNPWIQLMK